MVAMCNQNRNGTLLQHRNHSTRLINPAEPAETGHKSNGTAHVILCTHTRTQTYTALGQEDSASSEPAVTCRSRCSGKLLLTATIDDLIKLSTRRCAAAGGGEGRRCGDGDGDGGGGRLSASGGKYPGGLVHAYHQSKLRVTVSIVKRPLFSLSLQVMEETTPEVFRRMSHNQGRLPSIHRPPTPHPPTHRCELVGTLTNGDDARKKCMDAQHHTKSERRHHELHTPYVHPVSKSTLNRGESLVDLQGTLTACSDIFQDTMALNVNR